MNEKVKRVMEYIHGIAYRELQGDQYIELSLIHISEPTRL